MRKIVLFSKIENVSMWWHNERYPITLIRPHLCFAVCIRLSFSVFVSWISVAIPPLPTRRVIYILSAMAAVIWLMVMAANGPIEPEGRIGSVLQLLSHLDVRICAKTNRARERALTTHQSQSKYTPSDTHTHTLCVCRRKIFGNNSLDLIEHVRTIQIHINKTLSFHLTSFLSLI